MSEEYQRLQEEATAVDCEIQEIQESCRVGSATELAALEQRLDCLTVKRASLTKAMVLVASVDDAAFAEKQREFVGRLPHRYHSQGSRPKVIEFPGGVRVTVSIPYFHRQKDPAKVAAKPGRGLYPALMLLGIVKGRTPHVRQRMVKSAALLGSFEEAAEMLADNCINVSVNALREVCGHVGQRLALLTSSGSVAVEGHVGGRRIVVSLDGGRVRLREPRKGRTKKGRKRFEKFISHLRDGGMKVDRIATSPLVRTRETAEIMAEVFEIESGVEEVAALAPGSDWPALVEWTIHQDAQRVAWVGHAPCVGRLVALTIGDGSVAIRMQKGAVASLRLDDGPGHPGELEWLATAGVVEGA